MRTDWVCHDDMKFALRLLTPPNALALETCLTTGLRIGDVLAIETAQLRKGQRIDVLEHKTGKIKRVYINKKLYSRLMQQAGVHFVFEGARSPDKHRTRQAVWADLKRAAKALRIRDNLAPHSTRKIYAVQIFREKGLKAAQEALNHTNSETTLLYVLADIIRGHI